MIALLPSQFSFVILADESANWRVAGLRQLDRIVLAIQEYVGLTDPAATADLVIFWRPEIPMGARWMPDRRGAHLRLVESVATLQGPAHLLTTRLALERNRLGEFLQSSPPFDTTGHTEISWPLLFEKNGTSRASGNGWCLLAGPGDINAWERKFLLRSGKPQDGIVSRVLNRPVSRMITRLLLPFPITPTAWTIAISVLPLISFFLFCRGDYFSIVLAAGLFQLFSILDGCDGEIARAKYLESQRGGRIDYLCDLAANVLFVVGLGIGLSRAPGAIAPTYLLEGVLCGAFMLLNEILLARSPRRSSATSTAQTEKFYPRHRGMIQDSGLAFFGERFVGWLFQWTKRDVSVLAFFLLALAGLPQWILHLWLAVTVGSAVLAGIAALRARGR